MPSQQARAIFSMSYIYEILPCNLAITSLIYCKGKPMLTRESASQTALSDSHATLYGPVSGNIPALKKANLKLYCDAIPDVSTMLPALQEQGLLANKTPVNYSMKDYLREHAYLEACFSQSPFELLSQPLPDTFKRLPETIALPSAFDDTDLICKLEFYLALIIDILNNKLAQQPYEAVKHRENVTEQQHALQAGKISALLGMSLADVLAMLLHDIARPSINDPDHGHSNHCEEGRKILLPLGTTNYAGNHAFAKYLLFHYCPPYKALISTVSKESLTIQTDTLQAQIHELMQLDGKPLAEAIYTLMFMRLMDDMSKAPEWKLTKMRAGEKPDYFDDLTIVRMMRIQLLTHLQNLAENSKDIDSTVADFKKQLDESLALLLRAQEHSNSPSLYKIYEDICDSLIKASPQKTMQHS